MTGIEYIRALVEELHSTTVATIGADGHPQTRVIDMMHYDSEGIYFLTAKGKAFYAQLMFCLYEAEGEYFDISDPSDIVRAGISIGEAGGLENGYVVTDSCIGCKLCYSHCPQKCIDISAKPVVIDQAHCLHCGNCYEICQKRAIEKRG